MLERMNLIRAGPSATLEIDCEEEENFEHIKRLLAPGGISHSGPGENRQFWPDENSQS